MPIQSASSTRQPGIAIDQPCEEQTDSDTHAMTVQEIRTGLRKLGNKKRATVSQRFFKTGPGEYGEGDIFLGITVPELRKLAMKYQDITPTEVLQLLQSAIHEERLLALLILVRAYAGGDEHSKKKIYALYLRNTQYINNWDLVDTSAEHIVGAFLTGKSKKPLSVLAQSSDLWERRIAIMATFHFIKRGEFAETLKIARTLLSDEEDLIHKAVGWMLREVGKRHLQIEERFLKEHYKKMPRTMLRYAIERFPESKRQRYLRGKV
jgi:3-methyladenine DNA glycosylase AlkD